MNIYNIEETSIGNYFKINYLQARQLMIIFDTYKQRILDATIEDLNETIIETVHHFDNKVAYSYDNMPSGWSTYLSQSEVHLDYKSFINWFFRNRQQIRNYLIYGVMKHKTEKRTPIKEDRTHQSTTYGGVPLEIEDKQGKLIKRTFNDF